MNACRKSNPGCPPAASMATSSNASLRQKASKQPDGGMRTMARQGPATGLKFRLTEYRRLLASGQPDFLPPRSHGSGKVPRPAARGETSAPEMHAMVRLRPNLSTSWSSIPFITVIGQSEPYPRAKTTGSNKSGYFSFYLPQKIARPSYKHHLQSRSRLHLSAYRALPAAMVSDLLAWLGLKCQPRR